MSLNWKARSFDNPFCEIPFYRTNPEVAFGPNYPVTSDDAEHCTICLAPVGGQLCSLIDQLDLPDVNQPVYIQTNSFVNSYNCPNSVTTTFTAIWDGITGTHRTWKAIVPTTQNYNAFTPNGGVSLQLAFANGLLDPCSMVITAFDPIVSHTCPPPNGFGTSNPVNVPCYTVVNPALIDTQQEGAGLSGTPNWYGVRTAAIFGQQLNVLGFDDSGGNHTYLTVDSNYFISAWW